MLAIARFAVLYVPLHIWNGNFQPKRAAIAADIQSADITNDQMQTGILVGRYARQLSKRVPFTANCLPQALAVKWYLGTRNIETVIRIGARTSRSAKPFDLHAWLLLGNTCLTGAQERASYAQFGQVNSADL
ncbi:lasso peptide biosynthesis B2 protein [Pontixanthobacter sp.]|uniref:lasso peptide biosynthesis B2 protein n=1 Tax=Pontixanthobacter sp. TaxID=2792078 RepID=UPI003C7CDF0D